MNRYLWIFPFCAFVLGYVSISLFFAEPPMRMPSLVGMPVSQALSILTEHNLNARVLAEKEDPDLPSGTILSQMPQAYQQIKKQQSVFLLLSRIPEKKLTPCVTKKPLDEVKIVLTEQHIPFAITMLASNYPKNYCIAQYPAAHQSVDKEMMIYVSGGNEKPLIWPSVIGLRLEEALDILALKDIEPELFGEGTLLQGSVVRQQPLPGTIVTLHEGRLPRAQLFLAAE